MADKETDRPLLSAEDGVPYWRRNLAIVWVSQFVTYLGFSMAMPFAPFYIRSLGVQDEQLLKWYVGLSSALPSILLAVMAPIWGCLADRYGRKLMILRANYCGGVIFFSMGLAAQLAAFLQNLGLSFVQPVYVFLGLRLLQGGFSGTTSAAMTLVTSTTPRSRQGYALAILSTALYSGEIAGIMLGGYFSELFGYQKSFYFCGLMWALAALSVQLFVKENFQRKERAANGAEEGRLLSRLQLILLPALPILLTYIVSQMARFMDGSQLPLVIEHLNGGKDVPYAPRWTSIVLAGGFIGAMLSGCTVGRLIDKRARTVFCCCAATAGVLMALVAVPLLWPFGTGRFQTSLPGVPPEGCWCMLYMLGLRFGIVFCSATFEPVLNSWLSKSTSPENKGVIFGSAVTFRSMGNVVTHSGAAWLVRNYGFLSLYIVGPCCYFLLIALLCCLEKRIHKRIA